MSTMKLVIIGAGPGGYAAAIRAARKGADVTLIEKEKLGGTCLNYGCIPSKIMRRSADVAREVKNAALFGIETEGTSTINMETLRKRQQTIVDGQGKGLTALFKSLGIQVVTGTATIATQGTVVVSTRDGTKTTHIYDNLLIACGSAPATLPGLEPDGHTILSSDHALWMTELPKTMLVVGGGVIGCELAQIFHDLGVQITLLEAMPSLLPLPSMDAEIVKNYLRCLKKSKLLFYTGQTLAGVTKSPQGLIATIKPFSGEGASKDLEVEKILIATGRRSVATEIGLEHLGVTLDSKGWIQADNTFRTSAPNVWAIGDCLGPSRIMLAHTATAEGLAAVENMFGSCKEVAYKHVPSAVFSTPEIGAVGLTLTQAQEQVPGSYAQDMLFRQLGKAQAMGDIDGLVRLVCAPDGRILGGHIIGPCATSLIAELGLAVSQELTAEVVAQTIHAHPTLPEGIWEAAMAAIGLPLHSA